jgi:hypothetical protein
MGVKKKSGNIGSQGMDLGKVFSSQKTIPSFMPMPASAMSRGPGPWASTGNPADSNAVHAAQILAAQKGMTPPAPMQVSGQTYSGEPNSVWQGDQGMMEQRKAGLTAQAAVPLIPIDYGMPTSTSGSSGSKGGSGSSSGSSLLDYGTVANAYQQMLDALDAGSAAVGGGFDARQNALDAMVASENARNAGLQSDLVNQAASTRGQVAQSYSQGNQALQDLSAQYSQMVAGRQPAAERTLQAFGASGAVSSPQMGQDALLAQQVALARQGQSQDALFAQRPEMYANLGAEQQRVRQQQADAVRAQLLAQRQAADAQAARERAQLALQMQQALLNTRK